MSDPEPTPWQLFRYRHADGGSKDWAYRRRADGDLEVCWGRTDQVCQQRRYPAIEGLRILRRAAEKQAKGYVLLGHALLRDQRLELFSAPVPRFSANAYDVPASPNTLVDRARRRSVADRGWRGRLLVLSAVLFQALTARPSSRRRARSTLMITASIPTPAPEVLRLTDQTTLFLIDYHIWSGRKKLRPEDLRMGQDRPPDELISLGSKKVCDPQALRIFHRKRRQVERELLAVGTRFLGGYLVPNSHAAAVLSEANRLTGEARAAAEDFLADYDRHIDTWCTAYPRWEPAIRKAIDPVEVVRAQLRFRVQALRIETSLAVAEDTLAEDLEAWVRPSSRRSSAWPAIWNSRSWAKTSCHSACSAPFAGSPTSSMR